jgi:hypothetical protein
MPEALARVLKSAAGEERLPRRCTRRRVPCRQVPWPPVRSPTRPGYVGGADRLRQDAVRTPRLAGRGSRR